MKNKTKKDKWAGKTVKVDWKHIAKGEQAMVGSCPIAYAIQGMGAKNVEVTDVIIIGDKEYSMPSVADKFVSTFDHNRTKAEPITFKIGNLYLT